MKRIKCPGTAVDSSQTALVVLGTPLERTSYGELAELCFKIAKQQIPTAIEFCNTQVVTMRRHDALFRKMTSVIDLFIPDGMPLVWCMNLRGAGMRDRVYGPTFMRYLLSRAPGSISHYLLGGSPECGQALRRSISRWNRQASVVGSYHGLCDANGILENEEQVIAEINALSPDFVWIGLGTPKQQAWVYRNKTKLKRGILLGVGFAFDVNAGTKRDAPYWAQRLALTWLFRLFTEPKRLGSRYLRYNSLFLFYLFADCLQGIKQALHPRKLLR